MTCRIITTDHQFTAVVRTESPFDKMPETHRTARAALAAALPSLDTGAHGAACTRWTWPTGSVLPMEIGLIVAKAFTSSGGVVSSELPAGRAVHLAMKGGFENLPRAWETLFHWLQEQKLAAAGINWEVYGAAEDADLYALLS
ncbi:MAG: GyrI-like domain-containing protein [Reyranellales bacterium]